ncbi:LuxR C-terminal-related transcriptional regulator [Streptomyces sp. NPDC001027]|uniref:helix-turn-helix transcriptional regulator n=1 Tax=Streptomyces sp. NPDC001027 TaxID=3154771 RepID=UPI00332294AE
MAPNASSATATALGTVDRDSGLRIVAANDAFCRQLDLTPAEARGDSLSRCFHPASWESLREHFARLLVDRHRDFSVPLELIGADGEYADCMVTGIALDIDWADCTTVVLLVLDGAGSTPQSTVSAPAALTTVPARILEGVAAGLSTQQLASRLDLSSHGVEYHISVMMRKLKARNRSALVARAYTLNIFMPQCWPPRLKPQYVEQFPVGGSSVAARNADPANSGLVPTPRRTRNPA